MLRVPAVVVVVAVVVVDEVPVADAGPVGGTVVVIVGGAVVTAGVISGGWEVDTPYFSCNAFSNSCSVSLNI